jgi:chemotaxis protein CheX
MDVGYINPFIEAVSKVYETMLNTTVTRGECRVSRTRDFSPIELTALIGLTGSVRGTVALAFSSAVAINCVSRLLGTEIKYVDGTVVDGIAELVNMIAGDAKAKLTGDGAPPLTLGLPTVVRGRDYVVDHPANTIWLSVPFDCDLGKMLLRVTLAIKKPG